MRIAHIITRLISGGADENTVLTCNGQVQSGHRVLLIHGPETTAKMLAMVDPRVEVLCEASLRRDIAPLWDLLATARLAFHLRRFAAEIVHTHTSKAGILGRAAARLAGADGVVHGVHILPFLNVSRAERLAYLSAERLMSPVTDLYVSVSEAMRDACLDARLGHPSQHLVVRSGMDVESFAMATPPENWRELLGWSRPTRPLIVLMLAVFERRKRQLELLQALAPWLRERSDVCLVLAGDGPLRPACEAVAVELDIGHAVRFPGHLAHPQSMVALADVCVLASEREGLPRVIVQYVAAGKPVVVSPLPGVQEVVRHNENGIVATGDDVAAVADALVDLCGSPEAMERLAAASRCVDLSRWSVETMVGDLDEAYHSLLAQRRRNARFAQRHQARHSETVS